MSENPKLMLNINHENWQDLTDKWLESAPGMEERMFRLMIGLTDAELRVVKRYEAMTAEFNPYRINLEVENGIVVRAYRG